MANRIEVDHDWLVFVDSVTSLVAHRGLDEEARQDLVAISARARRFIADALAEGTPNKDAQ